MKPIADVSDRSIQQLYSLSGRCAVVTGGAQGLGKAIARRLAEAGADVAIADIDDALARAAASDIAHRFGTRVVGVRMDVADAASVRAGTESVVADHCVSVRDSLPESPKARALPVEFEVTHPPRRRDERRTVPAHLEGHPAGTEGKEPDLRLQHRHEPTTATGRADQLWSAGQQQHRS